MTNDIKLYLLILIVFSLSCCKRYKYKKLSNESYAVKTPCDVKFVKELPGKEEYILIGACRAKGLSTTVDNNAMKNLRKCACKNGGEIVRILSHDEMFRTAPPVDSRKVVTYDLRVGKDVLIGEVYIVKK